MRKFRTGCVLALIIITSFSCQKKLEEKEESSTATATADTLSKTKDEITASFNKKVELNGISFDITVIGNELSVQPSGLEIVNDKVTKTIEGTVNKVEIDDMNRDRFPEVFIYMKSNGSENYGSIVGYSVNNGKSMSEIAIPSITDNPKINVGYMGHDDFAIVEGILCQRFPIYNGNDNNAKPTGKTRQIQYKLKNGESSRMLVIDKIIEF